LNKFEEKEEEERKKEREEEEGCLFNRLCVGIEF